MEVGVKKSGSSYVSFSTKMCWDAVIECAYAAKSINSAEQAQMKSSLKGTNFENFVPFHAPIVKSLNNLSGVPPGSFLGFFWIDGENLTLMHAMIFVGKHGGSDYMAAGNKNGCIGVGGAVGWELLDLGELKWGGPFSFTVGNKSIQIRYRDMNGGNALSAVYGG